MIPQTSHSSNHPSLANSTPGPGRPKKRQKTQSNAGIPFNGTTTTKGAPTSDSHQQQHHPGLDTDSPSASISTAGSPYHNGHSRVASISASSIAGVNGSIHTEKPVTKRACNECRQQKLRCDVVQDPYKICSRCSRLKLECRIDSNFKRTVKRSKIAEMERELAELRARYGPISSGQSSPMMAHHSHSNSHSYQFSPQGQISQPLLDASASAISSFHQNGTDDALPVKQEPYNPLETSDDTRMKDAAVLLPAGSRVLEDLVLLEPQINDLFELFFKFYHPFLPLLDPSLSPSNFYDQSVSLFWVVVSIASRRYTNEPTLLLRLSRLVSKLVWTSLSTIPHSKEIVKALVLLTTWPFPTSSTMTDPTYLLSGMAVSVGMQTGLHRPGYGKDYTKWANRAKVEESEIRDRITVWACCNISAQSVSTGLGLPPHTQYDWTLSNALGPNSKYPLSPSLKSYLLIQRFADEVTRSMTSNTLDPIGLLSPEERRAVVSVLERRADELESELSPLSDLHEIYMICSRLHLRSFHLFDSPSSPAYETRIISLYITATSLVEHILNVENKNNTVLLYCPFYVYQMFVCSSFVLLKILQSSVFKTFVDWESGRNLFTQSLAAIRRMSVATNDMPWRLADVLTQLSGSEHVHDEFELRIRSRMSMSVMFDSLWKWREEFTSRSAYLQSKEEVGTAVEGVAPPTTFTTAAPESQSMTTLLRSTSTILPGIVPPPPVLSTSATTTSTTIPGILPQGQGQMVLPNNYNATASLSSHDASRQPTPLLMDLGLGMQHGQLDMDISPMLSDDFANLNWIMDGFEFLPLPDGDFIDLNGGE